MKLSVTPHLGFKHGPSQQTLFGILILGWAAPLLTSSMLSMRCSGAKKPFGFQAIGSKPVSTEMRGQVCASCVLVWRGPGLGDMGRQPVWEGFRQLRRNEGFGHYI